MATAIHPRAALRGIAVSRGIVQGVAFLLDDKGPLAVPRRTIGETDNNEETT
jgi:hypothetical protein